MLISQTFGYRFAEKSNLNVLIVLTISAKLVNRKSNEIYEYNNFNIQQYLI